MICWLLQKEHLDIRKAKSPEDALDWNDYKSMTFTKAVSWRWYTQKAVRVELYYGHDKLIYSSNMQVIYETLRLATVVNGLLRKTTQDVEMNGENPTGSILLLLIACLCKSQASSNAILCIYFRVCYSKRLENLCLHKGDKLWSIPVPGTNGFQPMEMAGKE